MAGVRVPTDRRTTRNGTVLTAAAVVVGAAAFLVPGVWAFLRPRSFHEHVAMFDPFNLHLLHDVGAFQIGVGVALLGVLVWHDALSVALLGATTAAGAHAVSHVLDRELGGRGSDPWVLSLLAVLLGAALVLRRRRCRADQSEVDEP
ncbi:hypothetical protein FE251_09315 [Georgenia wutianyii]|uniref:Uncharacterized protein n=1 Tax=Georgenia wutianyii TaxID=2585135 RepID=A0ABX5VM31_9MICO|nr:hypothetical protein [Georgenia wutianyii]QDB79552.1 hypothetical protein FE251_09315 [Georgenia wutianyii]